MRNDIEQLSEKLDTLMTQREGSSSKDKGENYGKSCLCKKSCIFNFSLVESVVNNCGSHDGLLVNALDSSSLDRSTALCS